MKDQACALIILLEIVNKRTHNLLKHLRNNAKEARRLTNNQQTLMVKPDHFVDLFTGDQSKALHEQRNIARKHNQK